MHTVTDGSTEFCSNTTYQVEQYGYQYHLRHTVTETIYLYQLALTGIYRISGNYLNPVAIFMEDYYGADTRTPPHGTTHSTWCR